MYSFFSRTGMLDVAKPIADAKAADYVGLLVLLTFYARLIWADVRWLFG